MIVIKILVALDNNEIKEKLNIKYGNKVYNYDFSYKEDVIEYLKRYSDDYIILTRLDLPGNISYKEYILSLKKLSNKSKIVIIFKALKYCNMFILLSWTYASSQNVLNLGHFFVCFKSPALGKRMVIHPVW